MCRIFARKCLFPLAVIAIAVTLAPRAARAVGGGTEDIDNRYPSACAVLGLRNEGDTNPRISSGVLIHPRVVLTAGHVIDWFQNENIWDTPPENVRISFDLDAYDSNATWLKVVAYEVHPLYVGGEGPGGFGNPYDVGLVILEEAVPGVDEDPNLGINPADLPEEGLVDLLKQAGLLHFGLEVGTPLAVIGYGRGFTFPPPADVRDDRGIRRYGVVPCMGMTTAHLHFFSDPFGVSFQRGDSGGPTLLNMWNSHVVLAVTSWTGVGEYVGIIHQYRVDTPDALGFIDFLIGDVNEGYYGD